MKRSRRVVLTMMGSAAAGAVSMGFVPRDCGPGEFEVRAADGRLLCRRANYYGGFGGTLQNLLGIGFTFGGQYFNGHGVYNPGGAVFIIEGFTVK